MAIIGLTPTSKGYEIKINCVLDNISRQSIEPILKKHKLFLKESNGFSIATILSTKMSINRI
jgi:hypothetical protein